ncbi:FixH family protein [Bacillus alkalicellulosilyticus]|uniref:FixH family protein n=1 Tax=Alkalihalobacterium alkalicellulosilyticum TaxID=1912214 RepID=UPI000996D0E8|nr:FixH family protein [Bacillus alkalicellulosilyticus]
MNIEKIIVKHPILSLSLAIFFIILTTWVTYTLLMKETLQTNWKLDVVGTEHTYRSGDRTDFHVFLEDENGEPITNANVKVTFDMPDMVHNIQKTMHHLEGGLYEAEVIFSMGGTWIGVIEASQGGNQYINQALIEVDGPTIPEGNRDPADHFSLEQPLPSWIIQEVRQ